MTYEETLGRLAQTTSDALVGLWEARLAGTITDDEFLDLAHTVLRLATRQGLEVGALSIRAHLEVATGMPQPAITPTLPPADDDARLAAALQTILANREAVEEISTRLERIGRNEPVEAATRAASEAMQADTRVTGWTRGLESDACELCRWWHREGRVWQPTHPMPRHTGCQCHPVPAIGDTSDNAQTTKQAWAAARARGKVAT